MTGPAKPITSQAAESNTSIGLITIKERRIV